MQWLIFSFGKISEHQKNIYDFYFKKIKRFVKLDNYFFKEISTNDFKINKIKNTKLLINKLKKHSKQYLILLSLKGKQFNSLEWAKKIQFIQNQTNFKSIIFIIGPSDGLEEELLEKHHLINLKLSLSNMTFAHELAQIILLESFYRSLKINNNEQYHK